MFLVVKIAIATVWKIPVGDLTLMKSKTSWIVINENMVSIVHDTYNVTLTTDLEHVN